VPVTLSRTPYQRQVFARSLIDSGLSVRAVARQAGMSQDSVIAVKRLVPSNLQEVEQCKKTIVGSFYGLARGCQENITLNKLEESSAYQLMGMASLAVTAARDMEGFNRPVFNIVELSVNVTRAIAESQQRLQAIDAALASTQEQTT
jgi:hypothetical protein